MVGFSKLIGTAKNKQKYKTKCKTKEGTYFRQRVFGRKYEKNDKHEDPENDPWSSGNFIWIVSENNDAGQSKKKKSILLVDNLITLGCSDF